MGMPQMSYTACKSHRNQLAAIMPLHKIAICRLPALFTLVFLATSHPVVADAERLPPDSFVTESMKLNAVIDGDRYELDGLMVRPKGKTNLPLAVLSHGSCGSSCRQRRSPGQLQDQANVFAQSGYAAFILMRRDNGDSDGPYAEGYGGCDVQDYEAAANATADDYAAAIAELRKLSYIDTGRIIAIGQSGGGIGVVALTARAVPGLTAAINFSGGRGGSCLRKDDFDEYQMEKAFKAFGSANKVRMLWVYTKSDHYWGPKRPVEWHKAFSAAGGAATLSHLPPIGEKGHSFFYKKSNIEAWRPSVGNFLKRLGLPNL
jgi:dienelactone hydrolase